MPGCRLQHTLQPQHVQGHIRNILLLLFNTRGLPVLAVQQPHKTVAGPVPLLLTELVLQEALFVLAACLAGTWGPT